MGNYIVDFVSFERKLIIGVDGGQHSESPGLEKDRERTLYLEADGFQLLRFWDNEVLNNIEDVKSEIYMALENKIKLERGSPSL
jgi:very-short-patch-repair endonuclease